VDNIQWPILRHASPASLLDDSAGKLLPESSSGRTRNNEKFENSKILISGHEPQEGLSNKTNGLTGR
jgi:hypothetical protein